MKGMYFYACQQIYSAMRSIEVRKQKIRKQNCGDSRGDQVQSSSPLFHRVASLEAPGRLWLLRPLPSTHDSTRNKSSNGTAKTRTQIKPNAAAQAW
jgi:hypothetical protein